MRVAKLDSLVLGSHGSATPICFPQPPPTTAANHVNTHCRYRPICQAGNNHKRKTPKRAAPCSGSRMVTAQLGLMTAAAGLNLSIFSDVDPDLRKTAKVPGRPADTRDRWVQKTHAFHLTSLGRGGASATPTFLGPPESTLR